jgi:dTDP-4-amino-4,6-dideoxygalactose transaminase
MTADDATPPRVVSFAEPEIVDRDIDAVCRVLRSGWLTTGAECEALESELTSYLGAPHVVSVSSGTAAIEIALGSLALEPGARVGVPTWTFPSTALAAVHHGAVPVLLLSAYETGRSGPVQERSKGLPPKAGAPLC